MKIESMLGNPYIEKLDEAIKAFIKEIDLPDLGYHIVGVPFKSPDAKGMCQCLCIRGMVKGHRLEQLQHNLKLGDVLMKVPEHYSSMAWPNFLPPDVISSRILHDIGDGNPILFDSGYGYTGMIIDVNKLLSTVYPNIPSNHVFWCYDQNCKLTALPSGMDIYETPREFQPYERLSYDPLLFGMIACRIEEDKLSTATRLDLGV